MKALNVARTAHSTNPPNYTLCVESSTLAINLATNSEELRLMRADCQLGLKEYDSTVGDLSRAATLSPDLSPHLLIRLSLISSLFLDHGLEIPTDSLVSLKRCLSSDPESKVCRKALKSLKKLEKELNKLRNWLESSRFGEVVLMIKGSGGKDGLIANLENLIKDYQAPLSTSIPAALPSIPALDMDSPVLRILYSTLCKAYIQLNQSKKYGEACEAILKRDPEDLWGLVGRGEKLMAEGNWEEAVRALDAAFEKTGKTDRDVSRFSIDGFSS